MIPNITFEKQQFRHSPDEGIYGDCWRTAVACLLGLSRDEVPHVHAGDHRLSENIATFLNERGLHVIKVGIPGHLSVEKALNMPTYWSDQPCMFVGESRTGVNHVVIVHGGQIIHDPSLTDAGIIGPTIDDDPLYIAEWIVQFPARLP